MKRVLHGGFICMNSGDDKVYFFPAALCECQCDSRLQESCTTMECRCETYALLNALPGGYTVVKGFTRAIQKLKILHMTSWRGSP